jgi:ADP-ribose pyrophosphatase YjhB (NUDIX family)
MDAISDDNLRALAGIRYVGISTSFLCYDKSGEFVMAMRGQSSRDEHGTWDQGGGALDFGSTLLENVRREVLEEYGAEAKKIDLLGYDEVFRKLADGTPTHWMCPHFAVLVNGEDVRNNEPHKLDEIGWFTLSTLPSPLHSMQQSFFDKYADQLRRYIH